MPKEWDAKRELLKPKTGAAGKLVDAANTVLQAYADAAHAAYHEAQLAGQRLTPLAMKAAILRHYELLQQEQAGLLPLPAPPAPPPPSFADHYHRWLGEQGRRTNLRTGQRLSQVYLTSLSNSLSVFEDFARATGHELALETMNAAFYRQFQEYFFQQRGQGLNTFGKHIRALKNFLFWAEDQDLPVSPKFHKFEAPDQAVDADALTETELLVIAGLDFYTEEARQLVRAHFAGLDAQQASPAAGASA